MKTKLKSRYELNKLLISVLDDSRRFVPAKIELFSQNQSLGMIYVNKKHRQGKFRIPSELYPIMVVAECQNNVQKVMIEDESVQYRFIFKGIKYRELRPPKAIAQCPDGSSGVPCVTCTINGLSYRICI